jgi:hypothetical protein
MTDAVDPAEFRCVVEQALDARAVHDDELLDEGLEASSDEEEVLGYPALALLVRARLDTLPATTRDSLSHGGALSPAETLAQLAGFAAGLPGLGRSRVVTGGTAVADLPPKRRESDPPAPVFQIKVGLRGAKPPIWRRLEVPGDIALAGFHTVIQIAFGWHDSHLHVFETPFGNFGTADPDLGHRSDAGVTLEQVAPDVGSKLRYTYDFGDDWGHDILIEKMLESSGTAPLPRCTGGRRAAPPDDCGGIWGYAELVEVLSDPADREHQDRLDWLGLEDAADFDPVAFDAGAVTRSLSRVS